MIKLQEDSDNRYLKLEERMLELEGKRFKETQELQLCMLSMLCDHAPNFLSSPASHPLHSLVYPPTNYSQLMYSFENPPDSQQKAERLPSLFNNYELLTSNVTCIVNVVYPSVFHQSSNIIQLCSLITFLLLISHNTNYCIHDKVN